VMKNRTRLPDFIIVGAMKAGTTSLHHIINHHDNVFIPAREIHFFDLDDIQQHPDFFMDDRGKWIFHNYEQHCKEYLEWYSRLFQKATPGQIIGEDSTTYMASIKAPPRIARLLPQVKLIFMLRDPVTRAYSHYWHLVNSGRAIYNFEETLRHMPGTILQRSYYKEQIERFMQYFRKEQVKFIIFEEFIQNVQAVVNDVCEFLGLPATIDTQTVKTHRNVGTAPRSLKLTLVANRLNRQAAEHIYRGYPPISVIKKPNISSFNKLIERFSPPIMLSRMVSLATKAKYPPMTNDIREFLQRLYAKENMGLGDLIEMDIERYWPYMKHLDSEGV